MDGDAELQRNTNTAALEKELRKAQRLLANAADLVIESPRKQGKALMDRLRGVIAEMLLLAVVVRPLATALFMAAVLAELTEPLHARLAAKLPSQIRFGKTNRRLPTL
jgi:hypothetical protein